MVTKCDVSKDVMRYMAAICEAARNPEKVRLGPSPRALLALMRCCQALAAIRGRDYVIPEDAYAVFTDVCAHRLILASKARMMEEKPESVLQNVLESVKMPVLRK